MSPALRRLLPPVAAAALGLSLLAGLTLVSGEEASPAEAPQQVNLNLLADPNKIPPFPDEGLSEEQRQERVDQAHTRNANWVQEFVDQGRDPRDLRVSNLQSYSPGATTLSEAREQSELIIEGRVLSTTYVPRTMPSVALSIATVEVIRVAKGLAEATSIEVLQVGGPAWTEDGKGALVQFESDPLLLPNQRVVLLLVPAHEESAKAAGLMQTVFGAGIYVVTPSGVKAPDTNAFAASVNGCSADEVLAMFD